MSEVTKGFNATFGVLLALFAVFILLPIGLSILFCGGCTALFVGAGAGAPAVQEARQEAQRIQEQQAATDVAEEEAVDEPAGEDPAGEPPGKETLAAVELTEERRREIAAAVEEAESVVECAVDRDGETIRLSIVVDRQIGESVGREIAEEAIVSARDVLEPARAGEPLDKTAETYAVTVTFEGLLGPELKADGTKPADAETIEWADEE